MPLETRTNPVELLERLVRIESPSERPDQVRFVLELLSGELAGVGARARIVTDASTPCLIADVPAAASQQGTEPVLFIGHADTVWPMGTLAADVPWESDAGIARGPGIFDMKAGLVVMVHALARAATVGLRRAVRIVVVGDEEIGSPHGRAHVARAAKGCSAAIGFESPHPDGALKVGRFGVSRVSVEVTGVAAHAALDPGNGVSATDELLDQLLRIRLIVANAPTSPLGEVLHNLGPLHSASRTNVVAASASAQIGLRFPTAGQQHAVLDALQMLEPERPGARLDVSISAGRPAWDAREADLELARALWPAGPSPRAAAGAADTNALGALPLAVVDGFGPRGGGAHARDEHVVLADIDERISTLATWLTS